MSDINKSLPSDNEIPYILNSIFGGDKSPVEKTDTQNVFMCQLPEKEELKSVVLLVKRDFEPYNLNITAKRHSVFPGKIYPTLSDGWLKVQYSPKRNKLGFKNCSSYTWKYTLNGLMKSVSPGTTVSLEKNAIIEVIPQKLKFKVLEIN